MAYCTNCGTELENGAHKCPFCGLPQNPTPNNMIYTSDSNSKNDDTGSLLYGFIGCCVPIVGLVLFLVWKDTQPKNAKAAGIGALISVICIVVFYVLIFLIGIGLSTASYLY